MSKRTKPAPDTDQQWLWSIAEQIANSLFHDYGYNTPAVRLVLEKADGTFGGGWSQIGATNQIYQILTERWNRMRKASMEI